MRSFLRPMILLLVSCAAGVSGSRAQFEGMVETKNFTIDETGVPQQFVITMWIRQGMARIQNSAIGSTPASTMIYRNDRGLTWVLNDSERTYTEMLQSDRPMDHRGDTDSGAKEKLQVRKSGRVKKILGLRCEQIVFRSPDQETEIWGTSGLRDLDTTLSTILGADEGEVAGGWSDELTKLKLYPLSAVTRVGGRVVESQEVTKIERKTPAKELFELPPGYSKESLPK